MATWTFVAWDWTHIQHTGDLQAETVYEAMLRMTNILDSRGVATGTVKTFTLTNETLSHDEPPEPKENPYPRIFQPCSDADCPLTDPCNSISCWGTGRRGFRPTRGLLKHAEGVRNKHEIRCDQIWSDKIFEFAEKWGLEVEDAARILGPETEEI